MHRHSHTNVHIKHIKYTFSASGYMCAFNVMVHVLKPPTGSQIYRSGKLVEIFKVGLIKNMM